MYYAFIINNEHKIKEEFREINAEVSTVYSLPLGKQIDWKIPAMDIIQYDPNDKNIKAIPLNTVNS